MYVIYVVESEGITSRSSYVVRDDPVLRAKTCCPIIMAYLRVRDLDPAKTWYRDAPGSKTDPLGAISLVVEAVNFNHKRITRLDRECPLQVELVVQATGKTVESDIKGRPALIPLHTQGSNQWTLSKRCARCKMHFRIAVLSSRHQKSAFVLRITAPTADDLLGYTLRSAHSSGIEVLSKINPIRRNKALTNLDS